MNYLIYLMGDKVKDISASFNLLVADEQKYGTVLKLFNDNFIEMKTTIFERVQFN